MPVFIHHYKKDYGVNSYSASYNYWANNNVRTITNNFFNRDQKFEYDANNVLSRTFYRQKPGVAGNYPYVDLHFERDASGLITSITGDKELTANYNPDLEIESVSHTLPQAFDESYTYDTRGNRLRGKLLVYLRDKAGLKYSEIIKYPVFSDVKLHSLGRLYKDAKIRSKESDE
jgi:hypothetical protein